MGRGGRIGEIKEGEDESDIFLQAVAKTYSVAEISRQVEEFLQDVERDKKEIGGGQKADEQDFPHSILLFSSSFIFFFLLFYSFSSFPSLFSLLFILLFSMFCEFTLNDI